MSGGCWTYPKKLGASKPANTSDTLVYTVPASTVGMLDTLLVINNTAGAVAMRLYVDESGAATYDTTTATHYDISVDANSTMRVPIGYPVPAATKVAVRTASANALRFILLGRERKA